MKLICGESWKSGEYWGYWFRVFGYGLYFSNIPPWFSERYGLRKSRRIFGIKFELLRP